MQLDQKEKLTLRHYSKLFDEFLFDDYDILVFLMEPLFIGVLLVLTVEISGKTGN